MSTPKKVVLSITEYEGIEINGIYVHTSYGHLCQVKCVQMDMVLHVNYVQFNTLSMRTQTLSEFLANYAPVDIYYRPEPPVV